MTLLNTDNQLNQSINNSMNELLVPIITGVERYNTYNNSEDIIINLKATGGLDQMKEMVKDTVVKVQLQFMEMEFSKTRKIFANLFQEDLLEFYKLIKTVNALRIAPLGVNRYHLASNGRKK